MFRAGADANLALVDESALLRSLVAMAGSVLADPDRSPALLAAWHQGESDSAARYFDVVSALASLFGMRLRYCYTIEQFATSLAALTHGFVLRARLEPELHRLERATGEDGASESWTLFAVGVEALMRQFFEPVEPGSVDMAHESSPND